MMTHALSPEVIAKTERHGPPEYTLTGGIRFIFRMENGRELVLSLYPGESFEAYTNPDPAKAGVSKIHEMTVPLLVAKLSPEDIAAATALSLLK